MLDIRFIRENREWVQQAARQKGMPFAVEELLAAEAERRQHLAETERLRGERNRLSQAISQLVQSGAREAAETAKVKVRAINADLRVAEARLAEAEQTYQSLMLLVPNVASPDTPIGETDADNVEIRRFGETPVFDFEIKDHLALGEAHDLIDIQRGVKAAGTRSYFLKGAGLYLHRAVQQLAIDLLHERGFTIMDVPLIVREEAMRNAGFFPLKRDQSYELESEGKFLVGTSEVPLVSYYSDEVIDVSEPIRLAAVSNCFRSEAGSAGRDVRGLYRVHQFAKVEQVVLCRNDPALSEQLLQEITKNAEDLLKLLELPYRVAAVCTGDLGQKNYKQYDIETWMPSRQSYGETHSSSNVWQFQARRSNIRCRDENGTLQYCHTLNCTAAATPRILIPLLENHQRADGSIHIPAALRKYMYGMEELRIKS